MTAAEIRSADPIEIFDALGIGWGVHELYPNPVNQQAFLSAVSRLSILGDSSITYEIGAASVSCFGEELVLERGGTARLSLRLFVHEVEWLELIGAPTAAELDQLFTLLAADENETRRSGGIAQALQAQDVWTISVTQRGLLSEILEKPWEEREDGAETDSGDGGPRASRLARMIATGASAEEVAESIVAEAAGDAAEIADSFCDAFRMIYPDADPSGAQDQSVPEMLAAYRPTQRTRPPVDTFAEAFFLLPLEAQARVLSNFLANREQGLHSLLLDQFAGFELAELAPHLDESTFDDLVDYARQVVDSETGTADELLPMVSAARDVKVARQGAADRIREMIEGIGGLGGATGGLAGKLRAEIASPDELGRRLIRLLFEIEDRNERVGRLVEAWCARISAEVEAGHLDDAVNVLQAVTEHADLSPAKRDSVERGLAELLRTDYPVFDDAAQDPDNREVLGVLLGSFGEPATEHLMSQLSVEEDPATRRTLIGLLVVVGATHSNPILRFFKAPEWYVVRNAVSIAGKVGGNRWVPHLQRLIDHSDPRVVVEVLRALTAVAPDVAIPDLVASLAHESDRVRETAFLLLKSSDSTDREAELISALTDKRMEPAREGVAELLFDLGTPQAMTTLEQIAKRSLLFSATLRDARRVARGVLGGTA